MHRNRVVGADNRAESSTGRQQRGIVSVRNCLVWSGADQPSATAMTRPAPTHARQSWRCPVTSFARHRAPVLLAVLALLVSMTPVVSAAKPTPPPPAPKPSTEKAIFFASDGMRPDLVDKYAAAGAMPTYADLTPRASRATTACRRASRRTPASAGTRWRPGRGRASTARRTTRSTAPARQLQQPHELLGRRHLQADTIAAGRRARRQEGRPVEWVGGATRRRSQGPVVDFRNFFSTRGVLAAPADRDRAGRRARRLRHLVPGRGVRARGGWTNVPAGDPSARRSRRMLTVATTFAAQNPNRTYDVYIYDSVVNGDAAYDRASSSAAGAAKDGAQAAADLGVGDFDEIELNGADGLIGARAGQTAGFYVKLDRPRGRRPVSSFKLYFTSVERVIATLRRAARAAERGETFEKYLADNFPTSIAGRLRAARGRDHRRGHLRRAGPRLDGRALGRTSTTSSARCSRTPTCCIRRLPGDRRVLAPVHGARHADGHRRRPEPVLRRPRRTTRPDGRVAIREGYIRAPTRRPTRRSPRARR